MKNSIAILLVFLSLTSCISVKKTTYFQGEIPLETDLKKLDNQPYKLQVNDILSINITAENPKLVALFSTTTNEKATAFGLYFTGYTVDRHGNIRIPYIGEINVLGYTEKEVREKIETELKKYIKNSASIFVKVKLEGIKFIVSGEVSSPGTVVLQQNQVSIIEAIANAGDIGTFGDRENVQIFRKTLNGVQKILVDMTDVTVFNSPNFYIQPNDVVYVPALKQKSWGTGTTGLQTFTTLVSILSFLATTTILIKNL